jgi:hypothetical protein
VTLLVPALIAAGIGASDIRSARAQCPVTHEQKFGAPDPSTNRSFGDAIALDGDVAFIGSQFDDYLCPEQSDCDAGSVQVFVFSAGAWAPTQRLTSSGAESSEYFGKSIAVEGDRALIGAYGHDTGVGTNSGYVYDYRFEGGQWVEHRVIEASDAANEAWFGWQVAMDGPVAAVAAQKDRDGGAVYVLRFVGGEWVEEQKLTPVDGGAGPIFGHSLAMAGGRIIVGANNDNGTGAAYVYAHDGASWVLEQKLTPPLGTNGDRFGETVAIRGAFCIVSATDENGGAVESGAAHVYWWSGEEWLHTQRLVPSDPLVEAAFGSSIAIGGNLAVIGAVLHDDIGEGAGQAYAFTFDGTRWSEVARLRPAEVDEIDHFGSDVAIDGYDVLIGADHDDDPCGGGICGAGAVYLFRPVGNCDGNGALDICDVQSGAVADCNANLVPDACDIASGEAADCDGNGVPDACDLGAGSDCNGNGVPDACDIAQGTSEDCDANGRPDSCDPFAPPVGEQKLLASAPAVSDFYGSAVAVLGDVAVVGAPNHDAAGADAGEAHVLRRTGDAWTHEATLAGADLAAYDYFGFAVALERDLVFAGAYEASAGGSTCGAVYVFGYDGSAWTQRAKLVPSTIQSSMNFGRAVAACGDRVVVGAPREGSPGGAGSAYVFRYDGDAWIQEARLRAPLPASSALFGWSVAIDGDVVVVGECYDDEVGMNAGAAHAFRFDGSAWVYEAKLVNPASAAWDQLGCSVAVSGDRAAIGALRGTVAGNAVGTVSVFRHDGTSWGLEQTLAADDPQSLAWLGFSTSIVGTTVVAGAYAADVGLVRSGAAYLFEHDGSQWVQRAKVAPSDGAQSDWFGFASAFDGTAVLVGAPYQDQGADGGGACYFYGLAPGRPVITRQPSSPPAGVGVRVAFAVTAVGAAPLAYRWQRDGQDLVDDGRIAGATMARLVIDPAQSADVGRYRCIVTGGCGETTSLEAELRAGGSVGVADPTPASAGTLVLAPVRPNPFRPPTDLSFVAPGAGRVRIAVYDLQGALVATLLDAEVAPGPHRVTWTGADARGRAVTSGVYVCRASGFGRQVSRKLALVR